MVVEVRDMDQLVRIYGYSFQLWEGSPIPESFCHASQAKIILFKWNPQLSTSFQGVYHINYLGWIHYSFLC